MTTRITVNNANAGFVAKRQRELKRSHVRSQSISYNHAGSPEKLAYRQRGKPSRSSSAPISVEAIAPTVLAPTEHAAQASSVVRRSNMANFYDLPDFDEPSLASASPALTPQHEPARVPQAKLASVESLTQLDRLLLGEDIGNIETAGSTEAEVHPDGTLDFHTWNALPVAQRMQLASSFAAPQLGMPLEVLKGKPLMKAIKVLGDLKDVQSALQELENSQAEFAKTQKRLEYAMARSGRYGDHSGSFHDLTARMPVIIHLMKKLDTALWAVSANSWSMKPAAENAREAVKLARASLASSIKNLEAIYNVA